MARNLFSIKASGRHSGYTIAKAIYGIFHFLLPTLVDFSVSGTGGTVRQMSRPAVSIV